MTVIARRDHGRCRRGAGCRRAFALPLVVLVALVASLAITVILDRQNAQSRSIARQIDRYVEHHIEKGFSEIVERWVQAIGNRSLAEALQSDGLAVTLEPEQGRSVKVYMLDAQGGALTDLAGLNETALEQGRDIVRRLRQITGGAGPGVRAGLTRQYGPLAVSVNSAPEPVLQAVIESASDGDFSKSLVGDIVSARTGGAKIKPEDLSQMLANSGIDQEKRGRVEALLTATPSVWRIVLRPETGSSGQDYHYEGLALIGPGARDRNAPGGIQRSSSILWLHRVPPR